MAEPEDIFAKSMTFYGVVQASVSAGESTAQLFERINAEAERLGVNLPTTGAVAFNQLRSMAVKLRNASADLSAAPATHAIVADYLAPLPYGKGQPAAGGPRLFDVRVNYSAVRNGQVEGDYVTLRYTGGLPATVGELRAEAADVTSSLVEGYGASLTAIGAIQVGEL